MHTLQNSHQGFRIRRQRPTYSFRSVEPCQNKEEVRKRWAEYVLIYKLKNIRVVELKLTATAQDFLAFQSRLPSFWKIKPVKMNETASKIDLRRSSLRLFNIPNRALQLHSGRLRLNGIGIRTSSLWRVDRYSGKYKSWVMKEVTYWQKYILSPRVVVLQVQGRCNYDWFLFCNGTFLLRRSFCVFIRRVSQTFTLLRSVLLYCTLLLRQRKSGYVMLNIIQWDENGLTLLNAQNQIQ